MQISFPPQVNNRDFAVPLGKEVGEHLCTALGLLSGGGKWALRSNAFLPWPSQCHFQGLGLPWQVSRMASRTHLVPLAVLQDLPVKLTQISVALGSEIGQEVPDTQRDGALVWMDLLLLWVLRGLSVFQSFEVQ